MRRTVSLSPSLTDLDKIYSLISSVLEGVGGDIGSALMLTSDEIFSNIVRSAFKDSPAADCHLIVFSIEVGDGEAVLEFRDNGVPFDPLSKDPPDVSLPLEKREPGGLGIFLATSLVDESSYKRAHGLNILTLKKRLRDD